LPITESKIVVEGHIEPGLPPYVILTRNLPYFTYTNVTALENLFVHDADIKIFDGEKYYQLVEYCSDTVPDSLLTYAALYLGVKIENLTEHNFCIYSIDNNETDYTNFLLGDIGKFYDLIIETDGRTYSSATEIPTPIPLDSIWYLPHPTNDSLFELWGRLTEPVGVGDNYRVFVQRVGKDDFFIPTKGALFDDKLVDGKSFNIWFRRGSRPGTPDKDIGYFAIGDSIAVKWCTLDRAHYEFWRTVQIEIDNIGNPIAA